MNQVSIIAAFTSGLLTFFAPCTFVALPTFISYISSEALLNSDDPIKRRRKILVSTIAYTTGFTVVFTLLGLTATAVGQSLVSNKESLQQVGGFLMIIAGIFLLYGEKLKFMQFAFRERKFSLDGVNKKGLLFPFIIGITSAVAWSPCVGPILGSILFLAGASSDSPLQGAFLLFIHSLGISIPFLIVALLFERSMGLIKKFGKYTKFMHKLSGLIIIFFGAALLFGFYGEIAGYIFRIFGSLGYEVH